MPRFTAIGEIMVEIAPAQDDLYRMGYAGDTFNTAWYARRLLPSDWTVSYATRIGSDAVSSDLRSFVESEGIDTAPMASDTDRTVGLYSISLSNGERSFSYWRGQSAAKGLADDPDALLSSLQGCDIVHLSGITLAILAPDRRHALADVLTELRQSGTRVSFDTNLRPRLWESEAAMRDGLTLGGSVADIVLPSFDEEEGLFGDPTPAATADRYAAGGAELIVVKNGADPVTVWDKGTLSTHDVAPVQPVDSTAAGDSFAAGLLCGLGVGMPLDAAVAQASTLAGRVVLARGALVTDATAA